MCPYEPGKTEPGRYSSTYGVGEEAGDSGPVRPSVHGPGLPSIRTALADYFPQSPQSKPPYSDQPMTEVARAHELPSTMHPSYIPSGASLARNDMTDYALPSTGQAPHSGPMSSLLAATPNVHSNIHMQQPLNSGSGAPLQPFVSQQTSGTVSSSDSSLQPPLWSPQAQYTATSPTSGPQGLDSSFTAQEPMAWGSTPHNVGAIGTSDSPSADSKDTKSKERGSPYRISEKTRCQYIRPDGYGQCRNFSQSGEKEWRLSLCKRHGDYAPAFEQAICRAEKEGNPDRVTEDELNSMRARYDHLIDQESSRQASRERKDNVKEKRIEDKSLVWNPGPTVFPTHPRLE